MIFRNFPSAMISESWAEASFGFSEWRGTCKSLLAQGAWIIQITRSNESFRRKQTTRNVRFHRYQTATKLKHVSLPMISNKEGRLSFHLQLQLPFRALFRKREHRPILWHYALSGTLDWWFCQSRFLVLPFPSEVNENPQKSFSLIEPQTVTR